MKSNVLKTIYIPASHWIFLKQIQSCWCHLQVVWVCVCVRACVWVRVSVCACVGGGGEGGCVYVCVLWWCVCVCVCQWNNFQNLWAQIDELIHTVRSAVSKNCTERGLLFAAQATIFWKRDIISASERAFLVVFEKKIVAELPQNKSCFKTQEFTRFLSTGVVTASSVTLRHVLSSKVMWVLDHCWVDTTHIHTSEWDSLIFQSYLLSIVTVTQSDLNYGKRSAALQRFRLEFTRLEADDRENDSLHSYHGVHAHPAVAVRNRCTVAKTVVTGISHWIVLFCERYWLADMWCLCFVWWCTLFLINCFGIELVLCDLYLTRFVLTKGLLFDTLFIVLVQIVSLWSLSIWIRIIFNTNELVNQTRRWNQMPYRQKKLWEKVRSLQDFFVQRIRRRQNVCKKCAAGKIFFKKNAPQAKYLRKCAADKIFWMNPDGYSVLLM